MRLLHTEGRGLTCSFMSGGRVGENTGGAGTAVQDAWKERAAKILQCMHTNVVRGRGRGRRGESEINHMWKWKRLQTCRIQPLVHNQLQYKIYKRRFNTILSTFPPSLKASMSKIWHYHNQKYSHSHCLSVTFFSTQKLA